MTSLTLACLEQARSQSLEDRKPSFRLPDRGPGILGANPGQYVTGQPSSIRAVGVRESIGLTQNLQSCQSSSSTGLDSRYLA